METLLIYEKTERPKLSDAEDVFKQMKDIKDSEKELFVVFYLDTKTKIIAREIVHIGTLNASVIHPREIFRGAILRNCNSIIISHNHPSGDVMASLEDIRATKELKEAGDILGIKVLDSVIVGNHFKSIIDEAG